MLDGHLFGHSDEQLVAEVARVRRRHDGGHDGAELSVLALRPARAARAGKLPADARARAAARTVAVGPHGSVTPAATLRKLGVDAVVRGECEEVIAALAGGGTIGRACHRSPTLIATAAASPARRRRHASSDLPPLRMV